MAKEFPAWAVGPQKITLLLWDSVSFANKIKRLLKQDAQF